MESTGNDDKTVPRGQNYVPAPAPGSSTQPHAGAGSRPKRKQHCRYFATKNGCRAGHACPFLHEPSRLAATRNEHKLLDVEQSQPGEKPAQNSVEPGKTDSLLASSQTAPSAQGRQNIPAPVDSSRIVQRPVPRSQNEDPREFQLSQVRRRFSPKEGNGPDMTILTFKMRPSDPDFPFDIESLECILRVPVHWPGEGRPSLRVTNKEMDRGYQINVERGFDALVTTSPNSTLLGLLNALDKRLEELLTAQKANTIKLVPNVRPATARPQPVTPQATAAPPQTSERKTVPVAQIYTAEQKARAHSKRDADVRQLEARLGTLALFSKASDLVTYTVPIEPRKQSGLPVPLQAVKKANLIVPLSYNLEPCRIELLGVDKQAAHPVEQAFQKRAAQNPGDTLLAHINYLSQNMHVMAAEAQEEPAKTTSTMADLHIAKPLAEPVTETPSKPEVAPDPDRSHIKVIPRPPEWTLAAGDEDDFTDSSYDYDSGDEDDGDEIAAGTHEETSQAASTGPERGIMLSFPFLELHGIELLELVSLSITVKCDRCKDTLDVANIKNNAKLDASGIRSESCKKCALAFGIGYRMDLMHANSVRAGYLDLDGCTVADLLPSYFIPTCAECSTPYPSPGVVSVRGESTMAICRMCHRKMTFRIPEVKFLLVSAAAVRASRALPRKKAKEKLGIVAGQELPDRGRCSHYRKSYRWFRFSCCSKVYPCDRCHDEAADHPNEHANRMICGFCSREQNYRPEDCSFCHSNLIAKRGTGFWEGGKGTRDKARMSRKDPRKYKRRGGTKPRS